MYLGRYILKTRLKTDNGFIAALDAAAREIGAYSSVEGEVSVLINAIGIRAKELVGDKYVFPVKG